MLQEFVWQLEKDFPEISFRLGKKFSFRPPKTVYYEQFWDEKPAKLELKSQKSQKSGEKEIFEQEMCSPSKESENDELLTYQSLILHELGHALLHHCDFGADVERLKLERLAWDKAKELALIYNIEINDDLIEARLDTYREWLYSRSKCKRCGATRCQEGDRYLCPICDLIFQEKSGHL